MPRRILKVLSSAMLFDQQWGDKATAHNGRPQAPASERAIAVPAECTKLSICPSSCSRRAFEKSDARKYIELKQLTPCFG